MFNSYDGSNPHFKPCAKCGLKGFWQMAFWFVCIEQLCRWDGLGFDSEFSCLADEFQEHCDFISHADSAVNISQVSFYGTVFYFQAVCYLFVIKPTADKPGHLKLSRAQMVSVLDVEPVRVIEQNRSWPLKDRAFVSGVVRPETLRLVHFSLSF